MSVRVGDNGRISPDGVIGLGVGRGRVSVRSVDFGVIVSVQEHHGGPRCGNVDGAGVGVLVAVDSGDLFITLSPNSARGRFRDAVAHLQSAITSLLAAVTLTSPSDVIALAAD